MAFLLPIVVAFSIDSVIVSIQPWYWFKINRTPSVPGVLYLIKAQEPVVCGDTVVFEVSATNKFYPGEHWLKTLMGCPGDSISVKGRNVFINSTFAGSAKQFSKTGLPLSPSNQSGVIPNDYYYAWAPHPDSYDSRYASMGLVHRDQILGKAYRII
jgi:conjugal transfer pilin signal peptidase TrbI